MKLFRDPDLCRRLWNNSFFHRHLPLHIHSVCVVAMAVVPVDALVEYSGVSDAEPQIRTPTQPRAGGFTGAATAPNTASVQVKRNRHSVGQTANAAIANSSRAKQADPCHQPSSTTTIAAFMWLPARIDSASAPAESPESAVASGIEFGRIPAQAHPHRETTSTPPR